MTDDYTGRNRKRYTSVPEDPGFSDWHRTQPGVRGIDVDLICYCPKQCHRPLYVVEAKRGLGRIGSPSIKVARTIQLANALGVPAFLVMFDPTAARKALTLGERYEYEPCGCIDEYDIDCLHGIDMQAFEIDSCGRIEWTKPHDGLAMNRYQRWSIAHHVCEWGVR